ncbi:virulence RhuM family protein [Draconibacterium halophilum]|uniref:Virulence RhuM family protein n=1 Tax=Draconibacterium halophilum TaxID=2706887 RepID=A0A6C0R7X0_9BACT|nr:virulence RhuM family protein [Draconibacterium halophilum]QIA06424.1 virulence RhuM family protein [Draconibacterium halophilum]
MNKIDNQSDFLFYQSGDGIIKIQVIVDQDNDTIWVTQRAMAEIFDIDVSGITKHIKNIFESQELDEDSNVQKLHIANSAKPVHYYNLNVIISVGYRVNSYKATQFRIWATDVLKEYLTKGFALDDDRLKQGKSLFGKDYFDELLERIREIRASERRFYQKITDIYAQCSIDYDAKAPISRKFFATVQNKLEYAITHHTAPEIIKLRANAGRPNMGLTSWKNDKKGGKILKSDVTVAKNYLSHEEISELNHIVNMYLDYAELQAKRNNTMKMSDWVVKLDTFLTFNEYDLLKDSGKIRKAVADQFAEREYKKFRVIQDREYVSDFDKAVEQIKTTGKLPSPPKMPSIKEALGKTNLSGFNEDLKAALDYDPKDDE